MILTSKKSGFGYMVVVIFASILLILLMMLGRVQSSHAVLQSNVVRRHMSATLSETALSAILAELNNNRAFSTHWHYRQSGSDHWHSPIVNRESMLGYIEDHHIDGVNNGIYSGGNEYGQFKAKIAPMYSTRENSQTQTILESEMYTRVEIVTQIGGGWGRAEPSYLKTVALIERRYPTVEHLLYDGEMLDIGALGPFAGQRSVLSNGRLYGYGYITFNTAGSACRGSEISQIEKIETPGMIRALNETRVGFADNSSTVINASNDSLRPQSFEIYDGFLLDGNHGARPLKLSRLPRERIKETAHRFRRTYGVTIKPGDLPYTDYQNPYNPADRYVDLDFGQFKPTVGRRDSESSSNYGTGSDDPEIIRQRPGRRILVYAEVPLRIWGSPDRSITIFSTEDIVIAGDFNQCERTVQVYENAHYLDYRETLTNGIDGNKVGALIMSEKRILIDISRPTLFAKNEIKPFFLYSLAHALNPSTPEIEREIKSITAPVDQSARRSILGVGQQDEDGNYEPRYGTIAWLVNNPHINSGGSYNINMEDLNRFFTPGPGARFGIRDHVARDRIIDYFKNVVRVAGDFTVIEQDRLFEKAWEQAVKEEAENPCLESGAMGIMQSLFEKAQRDPNDGIYIPEITINAALVSSTRRSSRWRPGNSDTKTKEEIGNSGSMQYLRSPGFIIQRVYGSYSRLGTTEPDYFISGVHASTNILRRRIWDSTNLRNRQFRPVESPAIHNIFTYTEEKITAREFNNFN